MVVVMLAWMRLVIVEDAAVTAVMLLLPMAVLTLQEWG